MWGQGSILYMFVQVCRNPHCTKQNFQMQPFIYKIAWLFYKQILFKLAPILMAFAEIIPQK